MEVEDVSDGDGEESKRGRLARKTGETGRLRHELADCGLLRVWARVESEAARDVETRRAKKKNDEEGRRREMRTRMSEQVKKNFLVT